MNNQDYKQKKRECWEEFIGNDGFPTETMRQCFNFAFDHAYALGKQAKDAERSKEKLMCLRDRTKVCNRCHACDIDTDAWHSMYSR